MAGIPRVDLLFGGYVACFTCELHLLRFRAQQEVQSGLIAPTAFKAFSDRTRPLQVHLLGMRHVLRSMPYSYLTFTYSRTLCSMPSMHLIFTCELNILNMGFCDQIFAEYKKIKFTLGSSLKF